MLGGRRKREGDGRREQRGEKMEEERKGRGTKGGEREKRKTQPAPLNRPTELSSC